MMKRGTSGAAILTIAALAAMAVFSTGCQQRQAVIEQTVAARAQDTASEAEAGHVPAELLTWEMIAEVDPGFEEATAAAFDAQGGLHIAGDAAVRKFASNGQVEWELPIDGAPTCLTIDSSGTMLVGTKERVERYTGSQRGQPLMPVGQNPWITSIAVGPREIFVADAGNRQILRFDASGMWLNEIAGMDEQRGIPPLAIPSPHLDIEMSPAGELVVANPGRRSIQYHAIGDGALVRSWGLSSNGLEGFGGCCNPTDIALLPDGRVVTSEKGLPRVKVHSADGQLLSVVVPPEEFRPNAVGIDLDASGMTVAVLDPDDDVVRLYTERGTAAQ
jgi:hypothetical protein